MNRYTLDMSIRTCDQGNYGAPKSVFVYRSRIHPSKANKYSIRRSVELTVLFTSGTSNGETK